MLEKIVHPGLAVWLIMLCAGPAEAAVVQLVPANTQIGLTVYAMGLFAQAGHFDRFAGTISVDPGHPESCRIAVQVEVASLTMVTSAATRIALSPTMMDPAHFPTFSYQGDCNPAQTTGALTLHGVTRPLSLSAANDAHGITASGTLHRQDFEIRGFPALVGSTIKIAFSAKLPPDLAQQLPHSAH